MSIKSIVLALGLMVTTAHANGIPVDMPWEQAKGYAIAHDANYVEKCYLGEGYCSRTLEWSENADGKGSLDWKLSWHVTPTGARLNRKGWVERQICAVLPNGQRMVCAEYGHPEHHRFYVPNGDDWRPEE